jgi:hypothetical protein
MGPEAIRVSGGGQVPPIVYGTAWKHHLTYTHTLEALRAGYRGIDTAAQAKHYNEGAVGAALASAISSALALRTAAETKSGAGRPRSQQASQHDPPRSLTPFYLPCYQTERISVNGAVREWLEQAPANRVTRAAQYCARICNRKVHHSRRR